MSVATARCLCGALSIEATLPSKWVAHCHCSTCRRAHGAAFVTWAGFEDDHCRIDDPDDQLHWYESSPGAVRGFCSRCGSALFWQADGSEKISVLAGAFDQPSGLRMGYHIFCDDKADFYELPEDGLPRYPRERPA